MPYKRRGAERSAGDADVELGRSSLTASRRDEDDDDDADVNAAAATADGISH